MVGLPPAASSAAIRGASSSARPDSLIPHVRTTRLTITDASPCSAIRRRRSGSTARVNISYIS